MSTTAQSSVNTVILLDSTNFGSLLNSARLPLGKADIDVTTFGLGDMKCIAGIRNGALNVEGFQVGDADAYRTAMNEAVGAESSTHKLLYAPQGGGLGKECWVLNSNQNSVEVGAGYGDAVHLTAVFNATGGPRYGSILHSATGATNLETTKVVTLTFTNVPAAQEFVIIANGDTFVFTTATNDAGMKAGMEALTAYSGVTITVTGMGALTGTTLKSGTVTFSFSGGLAPTFTLLASKSRRFLVSGGDENPYTINGSSNFLLGDSNASIQTKLRLTTGWPNVVVSGTSNALIPGDVTISGATDTNGGNSLVNGVYLYQGQHNGGAWWKLADDSFHINFNAVNNWQLASGATPGSGIVAYSTNAGPVSTTTCPTTGWLAFSGSDTLTVNQAVSASNADLLLAFPWADGNAPANGVSTGLGDTMSTATTYNTSSPYHSVSLTTPYVNLPLSSVIAATGNDTSLDNGAATANGYTVHSHFLWVKPGTTITVKVQHSTNNSAWTDLVTFTSAVGVAGIGVQRTEHKTASVHRYTRVQYTVSGSSPQAIFAVGFSRVGNVTFTG